MSRPVRYEKFQPRESARLALNYLVSMVDENLDRLPYWMVAPHENPAFAKHLRVDDAEIVASWYEGIDAVRRLLETPEGAEVQQSFYRHLMKSWGEHGLRFHEPYPWARTIHSQFHEMGYILSALNRILANDPSDHAAEARAAGLVRGLRELVIQRKKIVFWSGDFDIKETLYEFPNDLYVQGRGFDLSCHTGRGEQAIRNGVVLEPLVRRHQLTGDPVALDLAIGLANHLLGPSRYFNYRMEFFGHVHSSVWVAIGLIKLGRVTGETRYLEKGRLVYDYVRSLSSSAGWVPEYTQWKPMAEEHSETCCIKDMIECALELAEAGFPEYWNDANNFCRNQLVENQIKDGCFVAVDNRIPDNEERTYREIDRRIVGGFSGGAEPNCISLTRFRSIAGCCVGTAPQALQLVWDRTIQWQDRSLTVNFPVDRATGPATVETGYPNEGWLRVTRREAGPVAIRLYPWMGEGLKGRVNGKPVRIRTKDGLALFPSVPAGGTVELSHRLRSKLTREFVRGRVFTYLWRGSDVIDVRPQGQPLRIYQRVEGVRKHYPKAPKTRTAGTGFVAAPTQQKT
ncbi:MAG TPA: hypothetical protein PKN80_03525 [bacterium]|uniref:Non-reducing end beta-L-arabinofuranosidase n=1 Tax=candidate division TA06 bacterium ADurb.Bin417 TaxID=1852828 RepID=A0A1V5MAB4_UNCT6|nr:MAG: hypothetical protein BWY73_01380 [candidate division TA06 bacterium ADurb.Bin417]HNQ35116.1 hypothetical protein [bacterium]HNS47948.1 hypothetical protein [bacterium]